MLNKWRYGYIQKKKKKKKVEEKGSYRDGKGEINSYNCDKYYTGQKVEKKKNKS